MSQPPDPTSPASTTFNRSDCDTLYRLIKARRDIRSFISKPIPEDILQRILEAAHHAPSVGFMQPWNFIIIESKATRQTIKQSFTITNEKHAGMVPDTDRKTLYQSLKLEGIMESAMNIAITL